MKRFIGLFSLGVIVSFLIYTNSFAACSGSSPQLIAASASMADVAACIAISTYGDTINIPAGMATWTSGITITKDIKIVGAGRDKTTLTLNFTDNNIDEAFFKFIPDATSRSNLDSLSDNHTFEVSRIHFYHSTSRLAYKYGVWIVNNSTPAIKRVRIDNNKFSSIHRALQIDGYVNGVIDSNVLLDSNASYPSGAGIAHWKNDIMSVGLQVSESGIGFGNGLYVEDNIFTFNGIGGTVCGAANEGYGHVVRYNTVTGTATDGLYMETHSIAGGSVKGSQITEAYGNNFARIASQGIDNRGGKVMMFFNRLATPNIDVRQEYRDNYAGATPVNWSLMTQNLDCTASGTPYACCTGSQTGTCTAQVCPDDNSLHCYKINNSYFFNNQASNGSLIITKKDSDAWNTDLGIASNPPELLENREYWIQRTGAFDGSGNSANGGGVGCGTLTNRPLHCTKGVGYWATDQSCSDLTGLIGDNQTGGRPVNIAGILYRCTDTDTWKQYYRPFAYPHPLRASGPPRFPRLTSP